MLSAALAPWVTEVHVQSFAAAARPIARLPSATTSIVLCTAHGDAALLAAGPALRATYRRAVDVPLYVRIALAPGAARAAFGVSLHELTGRTLGLDALWGRRADELREALAEARGDSRRLLARFEAALHARFAAQPIDVARARLARRALDVLDAGARVAGLADALGASERYVRELFRSDIGMSAKRYARIARLRRVLAASGRRTWATLAAQHGFYDHAHLTSEFRALLGVTPSAFAAGELPLAA